MSTLRRKAASAPLPNAPTTPHRKLRIFDQATYQKLDDGREANSEDTGPSVPEIPLKIFFNTYMPSLQAKLKVDYMLAQLKKSDVFTGNHWRSFSSATSPKSRKDEEEDDVYKELESIVQAIGDLGKKNSGDTPNTFRCIPKQTPRSTHRTTRCRPDAVVVLEGSKYGRPSWIHITVSGEFKKKDTDVEATNQNTDQILWDINQTMRNDPLRRFTYGFTIENLTMRIWYADRSQVVVSEGFDINTYPQYFIHFFAAMLFGHSEDLGLDPTVERIIVKKQVQYNITVHTDRNQTRRFQTVALLSGVRADALRGRGSRVWECVEIDTAGKVINDKHVVLKDTWIDKDRTREGTIIQNLRSKKYVKDDELRQTLQDALLTVVCHGNVLMNGKADVTRVAKRTSSFARFLRKKPPINQTKVIEKAATTMAELGNPNSTAQKAEEEAQSYHEKGHYRCVFLEVGKSLDDETSSHVIFKVLGEVARFLEALHKAGWVHRDISSTNILVVDGSAKLADFEYAKKFDSKTYHKVLSGMPFFTPVEIAGGIYYFKHVSKKVNKSTRTNKASSMSFAAFMRHAPIVNKMFSTKSTSNDVPILIVYRPLHDLESLWWVSVHFVVNRKVIKVGREEPQEMSAAWYEHQDNIAYDLFHDAETRIAAITSDKKFEEIIKDVLHPSLSSFSSHLVELRDELAQAYVDVENDEGPVDFFDVVSHGNLHQKFNTTFFSLALGLLDKDVKVIRPITKQPKRQLSEDSAVAVAGPSKQPTRRSSRIRKLTRR